MSGEVVLPSWPVDETAIGMLDAAVRPGPGAERSSLNELLELYSQMAGSDTRAVAEVLDDGTTIHRVYGPIYHHNSVIAALIDEVRRLRALLPAEMRNP